MRALLLAALALLSASSAAAAVNRCTIDGRVVYQDTPCPGAVGAADQDARPRQPSPIEAQPLLHPAARSAAQAADAARRAAEDAARHTRMDHCAPGSGDRVAEYLGSSPHMKSALFDVARTRKAYIGMPEEFVHVLMCEAVWSTNRTQTAAGTETEFVMTDPVWLGAKYIYARNGLVYALHD